MCNRGLMLMVEEIMIIMHNINSTTNLKMQHLLDVAAGLNRVATLIICLQEMKLATLMAPTGYTVVQCSQHAR